MAPAEERDDRMEDTNDGLCVGIDLGTSRSSISASNGERHVVESYVGWPLDMVARKLVQKPLLVGREALDNRSMLDLRRPLERGVIREGSEKDEEAVLELLRHLMALVGLKQKGKSRPKVRAVVGVPAEAFRGSKQRLRSAMDGLADSVMLVSEPFAVAYGLEALLHSMIVDIGAGTTDLCIMQGRYPAEEDQRSLPSAGDAIDEQLAKLVRERHPEAQFSIHMIREWKERWSFIGEAKQRAVVTVPVKGKATDLDITDEMRAACESIVPPICETMVDLLARAEPEYQDKVRGNVLLAGGSSLIPGLTGALDRALLELGGGRTSVVKDPLFAGSDGGLAIARDATDSDWEKLSV
jgi:rod shape-determining protein MreB and related proteins